MVAPPLRTGAGRRGGDGGRGRRRAAGTGPLAARAGPYLQGRGLRGDAIELEITESHALPLGPALHDTMVALSQHGVRLAMDNFGMGHSSLLHRRHFRALAAPGCTLSQGYRHGPPMPDVFCCEYLQRHRGA